MSSSHARLRLLPAERMLTSPLADLKRSRQQQQQRILHQQHLDDKKVVDRHSAEYDRDQEDDEDEEEEQFHSLTPNSNRSSAGSIDNYYFGASQVQQAQVIRAKLVDQKGDARRRQYASAVHLQHSTDTEPIEDYENYEQRTKDIDDNFILRKSSMDDLYHNQPDHHHRQRPLSPLENENSFEESYHRSYHNAHPCKSGSLSRSSPFLLGMPPRFASSASSSALAASLSYHHIKNEQQQLVDNIEVPASSTPPYHSNSSSGCSTQSSASSSFGNNRRTSLQLQPQSSRSSLQAAANNFLTFVDDYERGLIECLSTVADNGQATPAVPKPGKGTRGNSYRSNTTASSSSGHSSTNGKSPRHRANNGRNLSIITDHDDDDEKEMEEERNVTKVTTNKQKQVIHNTESGELRKSISLSIRLPSSHSSPRDYSTTASLQNTTSSPLLYRSLRMQLAKVRALRDQYETGVKCTEALEKLMKLNKSRDADRELRSHERRLADIERQLEAMIGRFTICVEDLEGWARICPRDHYEIEFRHGKQRRVLHLRIGKRLERLWDDGLQEVHFQGNLKPTIGCRLKEVKSRWHVVTLGRRTVQLGTIDISMGEMLASVSRGQSMLLNGNTSGSLKVRIRCTWQPTFIETSTEIDLSDFDTHNKTKAVSSSQSFQDLSISYHQTQLSTTNKSDSMPAGSRPPSFVMTRPSKTSAPRPPTTSEAMSTSFSSTRANFASLSTGYQHHLARSLMALPTAHNRFQQEESRKLPNRSSPISSRSSPSGNWSSNSSPLAARNSRYYRDKAAAAGAHPLTTISTVASNKQWLSESDNEEVYDHSLPSSLPQPLSSKQEDICQLLGQLHSTLEDYRGQFALLSHLCATVHRLLEYFANFQAPFRRDKPQNSLRQRQKNCDEIEDALAEFDFLSLAEKDDEGEPEEGEILEDRRSASGRRPSSRSIDYWNEIDKLEEVEEVDDIKTSENKKKTKVSGAENCTLERSSKLQKRTSSSQCLFDDLAGVLILHLRSALAQLAAVGSWVLKGRELAALVRLRTDSFALAKVEQALRRLDDDDEARSIFDLDTLIGNDTRVLQLWQLAHHHPPTNNPLLLTWRQLIDLLVDGHYNHCPEARDKRTMDEQQFEDMARLSSEWLARLIMPSTQTKVSVLDVRAFFELRQWRTISYDQMVDNRYDHPRSDPSDLPLPYFFQVAFDLNQLMRKATKLPVTLIEEILFDRFCPQAVWLPADVTLTVVHWLYEAHGQEHSAGSGRAHRVTAAEVKSRDKLRELSRMAKAWLDWTVGHGLTRLEVREHIISELESGAASSRRAACYGIQCVHRFVKPKGINDHQSDDDQLLDEREVNSLLYLSMEDRDVRVRDEARRALKCLGLQVQTKLSLIENSRRAAFNKANGGGNANSPVERRKSSLEFSRASLGRSMPSNLDGIY